MNPTEWLTQEAQRSLTRLLPRLKLIITDPHTQQVFITRLENHFPRVFQLLHALYGHQYDFFYHLEQILEAAARSYAERAPDLRMLDTQREADPLWFQNQQVVGGVCYVDLFAGDLQGIREKIPYFQELGLTYLHLMPLFDAPEGANDGGYAISDFRNVNPKLGNMAQLATLSRELRQHGISLCLDFVFNHTSDQHTWALTALEGDRQHQDYYRMFPDRTLPDLYERHLREIFPNQAPGSFTYRPEIEQWVWTTFHSFQWDLNYTNPEVFRVMLEELLFLANQGVEVLRLDAVAFIWKEMGTTCENLPQAHMIIQAYNAWVQIVAPALVFKSEAIVHPDFVASYIDPNECPLSYNPTLMALLWEALATREVKLLRHSMSKRFEITLGCAWVNYVRVHDDIGWSFADEDAAEVGINGFHHRQFLNRFYTGEFPGSFAAGVPFNFNPVTLDMRISGTCASLAGLEQATSEANNLQREHALKRILLIHSIILSAGGIPLLYLGDEIATLNDYSYRSDPVKEEDSRWVHRPAFDWQQAARRADLSTSEGYIFQTLQRLIQQRTAQPELAGNQTLFFDTRCPHVLGYVRSHKVMILANFSDFEQKISGEVLAAYWQLPAEIIDLITGKHVNLKPWLILAPYEFMWLAAAP